MEKQIQELREELSAKEHLLRGKELRLREMQHRLDLVQASFSWQVTAPIRRLADWLTRMTGVSVAAARAVTADNDVAYPEWICHYDTLSAEDLRGIAVHLETLPRKPLISILMPVYNTPEKWLRLSIESVLGQIYPHWELSIADDASTAPHVRPLLEEYRKRDSRIKVVFRTENGHISLSSNSALELATGEFIALLDHDDELAPHALYMVAVEVNRYPAVDIIYSDEDKIDDQGRRFQPLFKPDWNPDLFYSQNYVSHLGVYRTALLRGVGGFRKGYEGSQDYDICLRCVANTDASRIRHIPFILYHWRAISGSTAISTREKGYAETAAVRALVDHFSAVCPGVTVRSGVWPTTYVTTYPLPDEAPLVSLIIPTRNGYDVLRRCITSIRKKTAYKRYEIIIVDNQTNDPRTRDYLQLLANQGDARVIQYDEPFNYPAINNMAVAQARGEVVGLLNNDLEVISPQWLTEMVRHALRPDIGAVGAKLYYPNNRVQHGGVILGLRGIAGHAHLGVPRNQIGYWGRLVLVHNLSAVTGACLIVRKKLYETVGGLDGENLPVAYNDVDFCLRLQELGYRNLWTPFAELYHHESYSRGQEDTEEKRQRLQRESDYMVKRWGGLLYNDPAYNPNLTLDWTDFSLATPPRVAKPWEE